MSETEECRLYFQELYADLIYCKEWDIARTIIGHITWVNAACLLDEMTLDEIASSIPGMSAAAMYELGL